jgi:sugar phosphate isomerase/epimerase
MKLGFSSLGCPEWDLDTIIKQATALGYQGIELRGLQGEMHLPASPSLRKDSQAVITQLEDAKIELVCLATGNCFHYQDRKRVAQEKAQVREFIELASELHCPFVRVYGDEVPRYEDKNVTMSRIAEALVDLAPVAAAHQTTILLENHGDFAGSRDLWLLIDTVNHPAVQGCWHPCHGKVAGDRATLAIPRLGRKIALAHIVDGRFNDDGALETYVLPGDGDVDMSLNFDLLRGIAYDGYLMLEWPKLWVASLGAPEQIFPAAISKMKAMLAGLEAVKELTAYKVDKNVPRYVTRARP